MTRRPVLLAAVALVAAASAALPALAADKDKTDLKGDLAKLQGTWVGKGGPEKNFTVHVVFDGAKCTAKVTTPEEQTFEMKGEITLDENAKPHKTVTWTKFTAPNGDELPDNLGIYAFEGDDAVKFCNGGPGNERPTEFKGGDQGGPQLFELKREKASGDKPAEIKGDLAKLQGAWATKAGPNDEVDVTVRFKGNAVEVHIMTADGQERTMKASATVDENAKPHKTISFKGITRSDGTESPENLGIYVFDDDDTVKVCTGGPGNERPSEFKAGEGGPPQLLTLKRKK